MLDLLTLCAGLATAGFGLFGLLAPAWTAEALDLAPTKTTFGLSEIRASTGGQFVVAGLGALVLNHPAAWALLGLGYAGLTLGRALSLLRDDPPRRRALTFLGIEAAFAAFLLGVHLPGL